MFPVLFAYEGFILPAWHVLFLVGVFAGFFLLAHLNRRVGEPLPHQELGGVFTFAYIFGYFGARALDIVVAGEELSPLPFLTNLITPGGMTFYGGLIGGSVAALADARRRGFDLERFTALSMPGVLLGLAFGRLGCFLNGDDYGIPSQFGFIIPVLEDGIKRVPVQLFEAGLALIGALWAYLTVQSTGDLPRGSGCGLLAYYAACRFGLEYLRDDPRGWWWQDHISTSQGISLVLLLALGAGFFLRRDPSLRSG